MVRHRRPGGGRRPARLPTEPVAIATGTAQLVVDPDSPDVVTLLVNGVPSSCLDLEDPSYLEFEYHQQMAAVIDRLAPGPLRALHLGAGACTLARWLDDARPGSRQVAVDIDAVLVDLVREWFALPRSPALRLRVGRGPRRAVQAARRQLGRGGARRVRREDHPGAADHPRCGGRRCAACSGPTGSTWSTASTGRR